ncbi:hypothetical protein COCMIDRAFT_8664 [Bipolaris oryzae ATCC 44560]|uniref:O-methyltransferase C-terminal domain-containing protein n=1 Tax=Bipolaris oryzae ATCC 44560 TaxID=930090 RepID=W6YQG0_COCMI|nr:uncharacterized protein COCMIDRAFT_8664 [Bipolaris oryzae ATCC 44560]EUC41662.1 hypothetical protein COCMIDRAFT_8664 [Bipolaris oryzae ATCC 44560]
MSSPSSRIAELAATIVHHTTRVDKFLSGNSLPQPSFDSHGPVDLGLPSEIEESRVAVLQATQELNDLLQGPRELIFNHQHNILAHLKLISRYDIAHKVPVNGERTFKDLAAEIGIDEGALTRILRMGIAYRVFQEPRPGVLKHSAASRQISDDTRAAGWVAANVDEMWPAAKKLVDALEKWPEAAEPNHTGFSLGHGTDLSFYQALASDPERARRFGEGMSFFTTGEGFSLRHLTDGYSWNSIASGTVVDMGGSHGDAAFALTRRYPNLHLVVQDLPEVIANSKEQEGLNVKFMAHNFFEQQPVKDADVYYYRWTLHNWSDKYCLKALRALTPALKKGARLLIVDTVMPPPGTLPNNLERKLRGIDLTMLEIGNAKERSLDEWKAILQAADARFKFRNMHHPQGSNLAIVEAVWEE